MICSLASRGGGDSFVKKITQKGTTGGAQEIYGAPGVLWAGLGTTVFLKPAMAMAVFK